MNELKELKKKIAILKKERKGKPPTLELMKLQERYWEIMKSRKITEYLGEKE